MRHPSAGVHLHRRLEIGFSRAVLTPRVLQSYGTSIAVQFTSLCVHIVAFDLGRKAAFAPAATVIAPVVTYYLHGSFVRFMYLGHGEAD